MLSLHRSKAVFSWGGKKKKERKREKKKRKEKERESVVVPVVTKGTGGSKIIPLHRTTVIATDAPAEFRTSLNARAVNENFSGSATPGL